MQQWAKRLGHPGFVTMIDYPYTVEGRKRRDRLPQFVAATAVLHRLKAAGKGGVVLIGKCMGGRIGLPCSDHGEPYRENVKLERSGEAKSANPSRNISNPKTPKGTPLKRSRAIRWI